MRLQFRITIQVLRNPTSDKHAVLALHYNRCISYHHSLIIKSIYKVRARRKKLLCGHPVQ